MNYHHAQVGGKYHESSSVTFSCNNGYDLSGSTWASCVMGVTESQGIWNEIPTCVQSNEKPFQLFYTCAFMGKSVKIQFWSFYSILLFYLYFVVTTTTTPSPSSSSGCFPSESRVKLENGKSVTMSELQIGDKIQTGTHQYSLLCFSNLCIENQMKTVQ